MAVVGSLQFAEKLKTRIGQHSFTNRLKIPDYFLLGAYVTNETGNYEEIAQAIRRHWQVETNNHIRDVTLKEDEMRTKKRI